MSAHMLEHLPVPSVGLHEMVRVLQPQAPLILVVTRPGLLGPLIQLHWGKGCLAPKLLAEMMTEVGLTNIRFYPFTPLYSNGEILVAKPESRTGVSF